MRTNLVKWLSHQYSRFAVSRSIPATTATLSTLWCYFVIVTILFVGSYFYHPANNPTRSLCLIKTLTQLDCPGCGLTRAFCAMAKGQITQAAKFNFLGPLLFVATLIWWLSLLGALLGCAQPLHWLELQVNRYARWLLTVALLYGVFRVLSY